MVGGDAPAREVQRWMARLQAPGPGRRLCSCVAHMPASAPPRQPRPPPPRPPPPHHTQACLPSPRCLSLVARLHGGPGGPQHHIRPVVTGHADVACEVRRHMGQRAGGYEKVERSKQEAGQQGAGWGGKPCGKTQAPGLHLAVQVPPACTASLAPAPHSSLTCQQNAPPPPPFPPHTH